MRWLLGGLVVSVVVLLSVAVAVARHVRRQRRLGSDEIPGLDAAALKLDELPGETSGTQFAGEKDEFKS
jgi:hypothetical protein